MRNKRKKYNGFSLVEMLITISILGIITLLVASTLTTLIKVSAITNSKNLARNDINFVTELMTRTLSNTNLADVSMFNSVEIRKFDKEERKVITINPSSIEQVYADMEFVDGMVGNELHVRSYGFGVWNCIGYFIDSVDSEVGYLLKRTASSLEESEDCFSDIVDDYIFLHSPTISVTDFRISYILVGGDTDNMFIVDTTVEPLFWPKAFNPPVTKKITRQTTVSTQGLTWF